jgi:hypothetical protein
MKFRNIFAAFLLILLGAILVSTPIWSQGRYDRLMRERTLLERQLAAKERRIVVLNAQILELGSRVRLEEWGMQRGFIYPKMVRHIQVEL